MRCRSGRLTTTRGICAILKECVSCPQSLNPNWVTVESHCSDVRRSAPRETLIHDANQHQHRVKGLEINLNLRSFHCATDAS
ncbi:hypothetical protein GOODEAATRI_002101 [Goodea atripinnis]|uniref:Uncharacterized protein n=1 Tax=Goodea atripinnis TaxID=208336 RepID=A0ABV0MEB3_9TELE